MSSPPSSVPSFPTVDPPRPPAGRALGGRTPWAMLAAAIVLQGATAPGQTVGISVFVDELAGDLDLSRSAVSSAYLVGTLTGALAMPAAGKLIDRRGLRFATLAFGAAFGAMLVAMAGVVGFVSLAVGFAGTRALGQGALTLTATTTVAVWFEDRRGLATGIKTAAGGALMGLVPLVSAWLITTVGWRSTWVILGFGAWIVVLPLGYWLVSNPHRPTPRDRSDQDLTLLAPASSASPPVATETTCGSSPTTTTSTSSSFTPPSWPVAAVIRHPAFLAMAAAGALAALVGTGLMFHHVDLLAVRGLTTAQAAAVFLPLTLASAVGAIAAGRGVDLTGDYTAVLQVLSAASLALAAVVLMVKPPTRDVRPAS